MHEVCSAFRYKILLHGHPLYLRTNDNKEGFLTFFVTEDTRRSST